MAFRFKRICSPIKGLKVNVNKGSISSSVGLPGLGATMGSRGVSANFGLPGTGLSYRSDVNWNNKQISNELLLDNIDFDSDSDFNELEIKLQPKSEYQDQKHVKKNNGLFLNIIPENLDDENTDYQTKLKEKQSKYHFWPWIIMLVFSFILVSLQLKVIPVMFAIYAIWQIIKIKSKMNKKILGLTNKIL